MAGEDEYVVAEDCEEEDYSVPVEETQDLDYFGSSRYGNTADSTVIKETPMVEMLDTDSANRTLVEEERQLNEVQDGDDHFDDNDDDIMIIAAEQTVNQSDIPGSQPKTGQSVANGHAKSTSGAGTSAGNTPSGGRTYRRGHRTSRLSRNRPSNNKNAKLQQAASDNNQASVLDFFQPLWGRAKQAVQTLTKVLSPGSSTAQSTGGVTNKLSRDNGNETGGATNTCDDSSDAEAATSTCSSVNSTAGNKPWPLTAQQTSKAGRRNFL